MKKSRFLLPLFLLPALLLLGFQMQLNLQSTDSDKLPFSKRGNSQWFKVNDDARLNKSDILQKYAAQLGLTKDDVWINYKTETDHIGMTHSRYQLHRNGIPVEGAELLIHEADGQVRTFNGLWTPQMEANTAVTLSKEEAIARALEFLPSDRYVWNDAGAENLLKRVNRNPNATAYPQPELVLYNNTFPNVDAPFTTAYKMIVQAYEPHTRRLIYVDAQNGNILHNLELLHHTNTPGVAETKYHETQQIFTDSIAPDSFRLYETTRGVPIHTMDLNNSDQAGDAVDFWDTDNYWNNVNADQDEVATDAHFSAEMTYDFYHDHLGHSSVDGNDTMQMLCLVHYSNNVVNAFWNGNWTTLGDGNGSEWSPLTSLDVIGHEFTHGVTQRTANLIYQNEPGALNESFSDIFGTAIEFWGEPDSADYYIGEDFHVTGNGFRDMANPNAEGDPDTYLGSNWESGSFDNGGVHINSGVQNFWFYLLTEGGTGTNDNGFQYNVEPVGMDTSTTIAFRNLKYYLTRFSQYSDARWGSLVSAEDLYGACSFPAIQTINAWRAVGVGELYDDNDFEMIGILGMEPFNCGLSNQEYPTIQMRYNGCLTPLENNAIVPLEITVDNGAIQRDTILLPSGMLGGDSIVYTIDTPISGLETMGDHVLTIRVALPGDVVDNNNTATFLLENVLSQNTDFDNNDVLRPTPDCFMTQVPVEIEVTFLGCDFIESGAELFLNYAFDGNVVTESTTLTTGYERGESFFYTFNTLLNASTYLGNNEITSWVDFPEDFIAVNDSTRASVVNPDILKINRLMTFDMGEASLDSFYFESGAYSNAYISDVANFDGDFGVYMTGRNPQQLLDDGNLFAPQTADAGWLVHEELSAKTCICADARNLTSLELSFDKRQLRSQYIFNNLGTPSPYSNLLRVLVNGEQASPTYFTESQVGQWSNESVDLNDYLGSLLEICFESRCMTSSDFDGLGDRVYLDNILLSGLVNTEQINNNNFTLSVSPNPSDGLFLINYENNQVEELQLELFDVNGRQLWAKAVDTLNGHVTLDLSDNPSGLYYLRMGNGEQFVNKKIVLTGNQY